MSEEPEERFNEKEKEILNILYHLRIPVSTNKVSEDADFSWKTVQKYLEQLQHKGYVIELEEDGSTRWRLKTEDDEE